MSPTFVLRFGLTDEVIYRAWVDVGAVATRTCDYELKFSVDGSTIA